MTDAKDMKEKKGGVTQKPATSKIKKPLTDLQRKLDRAAREERALKLEDFIFNSDLGKFFIKTLEVRKAELCLQGMTDKKIISDWGDYREARGRILEIKDLYDTVMSDVRWLRKKRKHKQHWSKDPNF